MNNFDELFVSRPQGKELWHTILAWIDNQFVNEKLKT